MSNPFRLVLNLYSKSFSGLSRDVWLLSLVLLINRCGTMVIVFMTIYLTEKLNWTLTETGIAMSIFGLGSTAGSFIGGWLTDRIGYYKTMFWSLFFGGLSFFILVRMDTFLPYCITVFLVSTMNEAFRPASMASISAYAKLENQNRSLSLVRLAINLGFSMGVGAGGLIAEYFGFDYLFYIDGLTCIFAAIFLRIVLKEKEEKSVDQDLKKEELPRNPADSAYKDRIYLFFAFFVFLNAIVFGQLWNTVPVYYTEILDISKDDYGWIMLVNGVLIVIFEMPLVYILENKYKKITLVLVGSLLIVFGFIIYNLATFWQLAIAISMISVTFGEILSFPFSNAFALGRSKPGRRGEYMGVFTMAWSLAMIIAPILGMRIADNYGFTMLWYLISGIGMISCLGLSFLKMKLKNEESLSPVSV
jgi:predicted MFS family arabinose efflux permease